MPSLFQAALGNSFDQLQPQLQEYFGVAPGSGSYIVGEGIFDVAGSPHAWLRPALKLNLKDQTFFPEYGEQIPFKIEAHSHLDPFHRPSLTMIRTLHFPDATRIFRDTTSLTDQGLVDYLGASSRIATGVKATVGPNGSFRSVSEKTRFFPRLKEANLKFPIPGFLDARAYTWQWWRPETEDFHIQVKVQHPAVGSLFHYSGQFRYRLESYPNHEAASHGVPNVLPLQVQPDRWEALV